MRSQSERRARRARPIDEAPPLIRAVAVLIATCLFSSGAAATEITAAPVEIPSPESQSILEGIEPLVQIPATPLEILETTIEPGTLVRLELRTSESFAGSHLLTPIAVIHGSRVGPSLCVVAGIHGDEVNGVDVVRRLLRRVDPEELRGTVIAVPIANLSAFRRGSRYLPDRRDLNRFFPGRAYGSSASRIAYGIFESVVRHCDGLVDLHTGSFHRSNVHQLRANLADEGTALLSREFGASIVVNSAGREGTLRRAATDAGIPAITVEAGESARFDAIHAGEALDGILRLLAAKGMITYEDPRPTTDQTAYLQTRWLRSDHGGILVTQVRLGDPIHEGQTIGTISDPLSDRVTKITSPLAGRLIGMAMDQVVMPGFAAFHIAYDARAFRGVMMNPGVPQETASDPDSEGLDLEERPE